MTALGTGDDARETESRIDLYIAQHSSDSDLAIDNLRTAVQERSIETMPIITIIDVHASPLVAYREGVFVTPTLVVTVDGVSTRMFGNLSNPETTRSLLARLR